jgi:hypothetical protein
MSKLLADIFRGREEMIAAGKERQFIDKMLPKTLTETLGEVELRIPKPSTVNCPAICIIGAYSSVAPSICRAKAVSTPDKSEAEREPISKRMLPTEGESRIGCRGPSVKVQIEGDELDERTRIGCGEPSEDQVSILRWGAVAGP